MRKRLILPALLLFMCTSALGRDPALSVYDRVSPATVLIKTENSAGTGFIVRPNGTIVTAFHLIDGARRVTVQTKSGEIFGNVSLLAKDERRDIAIIKVPGFYLPSVELGNSNNVHPSQPISVIGNPLGTEELQATITDGIVAGVRDLGSGYKLIQITAPISKGSIGGPVVTDEGETVGVAAVKVISGETLNFAIPINYVRGILGDIRQAGPIARWETNPTFETPREAFFRIWTNLFFFYPWLIATLVVGFVIWLCLGFRYWWLARVAADKPHVAPISAKGKISKEFDAREAWMVFNAHVWDVIETFWMIKQSQGRLSGEVIKQLSQGRLSGEVVGLMMSAPIVLLPTIPEPSQFYRPVDDKVVVEIGTIKIPIGAMKNFFVALFSRIPVPFRRRYLSLVIHVSLVSYGPGTHLIVYRDGQYASSSSGPESEVELLREAVFMILQMVQDKTIPGRNWLGKKYFAHGLEKLDKARRTGKPELMDQAIKSFCHAAEADEENYEALYIRGAMLTAQREEGSVATAQMLLTQALKTDKLALRALVNAGLANCYAQQHFRLANRRAEVLELARKHVKQARKDWEEARMDRRDPWILATDALVMLVEAGGKNKEEKKEQYLSSAQLYLEATDIDRDNGTYYNALGWLLLQLENLGEPGEGIRPNEIVHAAEKAEHYLQLSLERDPKNKLAHANLCLVYATDLYQKKDEEKYLHLCRQHGLRAVKLDSNYINGYRDLAVSLLRYGKLNEAYQHFETAVQRAPTIEKKQELIDETLKALPDMDEMEDNDRERERWRHPDLRLFEPLGVGRGRND